MTTLSADDPRDPRDPTGTGVRGPEREPTRTTTPAGTGTGVTNSGSSGPGPWIAGAIVLAAIVFFAGYGMEHGWFKSPPSTPGPAATQTATAPAATQTGDSANTCDAGYKYYPDRNECQRIYDRPVLAEKAKCTPGEKRRVPDPNRPGYTLLQVCGKVAGN